MLSKTKPFISNYKLETRVPFLSVLPVRRAMGKESEERESLELPRSADDEMSSDDDSMLRHNVIFSLVGC